MQTFWVDLFLVLGGMISGAALTVAAVVIADLSRVDGAGADDLGPAERDTEFDRAARRATVRDLRRAGL